MQGSAILFSEMTAAPEWEARFHAWYDGEHIPVRMAVPGFRSAQRYRAHDAAGHLAVYELADAAVLDSPAYQQVKQHPSETTAWMLANVQGFTRYTCTQISETPRKGSGNDESDSEALDSPVLYAVWFTVPQDRLADFDDWYENDHVPLLMQSDDWRLVRRFAVNSGHPQPHNRLALHYLRDLRALDSPERERARATPWRARLAKEPWFQARYSLFHRLANRQLGLTST